MCRLFSLSLKPEELCVSLHPLLFQLNYQRSLSFSSSSSFRQPRLQVRGLGGLVSLVVHAQDTWNLSLHPWLLCIKRDTERFSLAMWLGAVYYSSQGDFVCVSVCKRERERERERERKKERERERERKEEKKTHICCVIGAGNSKDPFSRHLHILPLIYHTHNQTTQHTRTVLFPVLWLSKRGDEERRIHVWPLYGKDVWKNGEISTPPL